jgi:hypothetical protein
MIEIGADLGIWSEWGYGDSNPGPLACQESLKHSPASCHERHSALRPPFMMISECHVAETREPIEQVQRWVGRGPDSSQLYAQLRVTTGPGLRLPGQRHQGHQIWELAPSHQHRTADRARQSLSHAISTGGIARPVRHQTGSCRRQHGLTVPSCNWQRIPAACPLGPGPDRRAVAAGASVVGSCWR